MKNPPKCDPSDWTIIKILDWTTSYFKSHHIDSSRATAEILLAHILKLKRIDLYLQYDRPLAKDELALFRTLIQRRCRREPVAYIVGQKGFWSMDFDVSPAVLIPRPDTECLLESVLALLPSRAAVEAASSPPQYVLELGTGSGAVIVSLVAERPGHFYFATDRSIRAVGQARKNASRHALSDKISFLAADWFDAFRKRSLAFDIIFSNPPYIPSADIPELQAEICDHEPLIALDGDKDGLSCIRHLIRDAHFHLRPGGVLLLEIGHDQQSDVREMIESCGYYRNIVFVKDFAGKERVVQMIKK